MKTIDKTKLAVLSIGVLIVVTSLVGAVKNLNLMDYFFPLYTGLILMGVTLLNKGERQGKSATTIVSE